MVRPNFVTVKATMGDGYRCVVQHNRTMQKKEAYKYLGDKLGYSYALIKAVCLGLVEVLKENAARGNISLIDGAVSVRHSVKGGFETSRGPWEAGKNMLLLQAIEQDPFKSAMSGVIPLNNMTGAKPAISSVLDMVTGEYDVITGTDAFSIAGTDLAPDADAEDEYVGFMAADGTITKAEITESTLQIVKAKLTSALTAGNYTLVVATRSGLGEEFGVKSATRKVTVK